MTRLYQDSLGGRLGAQLLIAGTTMDSPALAAMREVVAGDEMRLVLDPDGRFGAPDIVTVTAHTAAATTATITRGTSARQHEVGTDWIHGMLAEDVPGQSCKVYRTAAYAVAAGAAVVPWDTEDWDPYGWWTSGTPERITPTFPGVFLVNGSWATSATGSGRSFARLQKNGVDVPGGASDVSANTGFPHYNVSCLLRLNGSTDYVSMNSYAEFGGMSLSNLSALSVVRLGAL